MTKVLLVEDDNNLREIYEARLTAEGYEISTAQDGEEALVVAKQIKPDLVISDVMMPKISGFEMLDILRNTPGLEHVKVIMLTALGQGEDRDRADSLGANKYLVKSQVTLEDIVKTAQELLAGDDEGLPSGIAQDTPPSAASEPVATEPSIAAPAESTATEPVATATPATEAPAPAAAMPAEPTVPATPEVVTPTEPAVAPTPEATPDSPAVPAPAASEAENGSTAQEAALVEQQIDSFAQQAVTPPAAVTEEVTPAAPAEPVVAPATEEPAASSTSSSDSNTAADDKLMADAVEQLSGNETVEPEPSPVLPAPSPTPAPLASEPLVAPEPTETVEPSAASNVAISGKKVIQPLNDTEAKPDIHELLAREEANSTATPAVTVTPPEPTVSPVAEQPVEPPAPQPSPVATPEPAPAAQSTGSAAAQPAPATPPAADSSAVDPNSIAL
jgi:CheY-like chemotaxis protein